MGGQKPPAFVWKLKYGVLRLNRVVNLNTLIWKLTKIQNKYEKRAELPTWKEILPSLVEAESGAKIIRDETI